MDPCPRRQLGGSQPGALRPGGGVTPGSGWQELTDRPGSSLGRRARTRLPRRLLAERPGDAQGDICTDERWPRPPGCTRRQEPDAICRPAARASLEKPEINSRNVPLPPAQARLPAGRCRTGTSRCRWVAPLGAAAARPARGAHRGASSLLLFPRKKVADLKFPILLPPSHPFFFF